MESQWSASHSGYYAWEKNYQQPLNRGLGGPQTQRGHFEEDTNLVPPASSQSLDHPARSSVTMTISCSLSLRHYTGHLVLWYFGQ